MIYHSYHKKWKLLNAISLYAICMTKKLCCSWRSLKQALKYGLILKEVYRVIYFNQKALLKLYIVMNTKLGTKAKKWFWEWMFQINE